MKPECKSIDLACTDCVPIQSTFSSFSCQRVAAAQLYPQLIGWQGPSPAKGVFGLGHFSLSCRPVRSRLLDKTMHAGVLHLLGSHLHFLRHAVAASFLCIISRHAACKAMGMFAGIGSSQVFWVREPRIPMNLNTRKLRPQSPSHICN